MTAKPVDRVDELLDHPQFPRFKEWVIRRTGLSYYEDKDRDLALAVQRWWQHRPGISATELLDPAEDPTRAPPDALVEELTIGETFFFRHTEMFQALREQVLPDLRRRNAASRSLRIWSAGCSIGAEPYSLAILLHEQMAAEFDGWSIEIVGTDINRRFLSIAQRAAYDPWSLRALPAEVRQHCFKNQGAKQVLEDRYRQGVRFMMHNLASDAYPDQGSDLCHFDLIICRNVMIYFSLPVIQQVVGKMHESLKPGGWLLVGHAEPHTETFRAFRTINAPGAVLYRRPASDEEEIRTPGPAHEWPSRRIAVPPGLKGFVESPASSPEKGVPTARSDVFKPSPLAAVHPLAAVQVAADAGRLEQAQQLCDALLAAEPLNAEAHYYHGVILLQFNQWQQAASALQRCLYLRRDLALAHYYLGVALQKLDRDPLRHFRNALEWLASQPEGHEEVALGQGLTVDELRSLLAARLPALP